MTIQSLKSKHGEIKYRRLIAKQHAGEHTYFKEELNRTEIKKLLGERLLGAKKTFQDLKKRRLLSSPFLEIGAEYALVSTLLKNKFNLEGFASDISFYSLKKASYFAQVFNFRKLPGLVCADAYALPFRKNSLPFIFTYETLHHFPDPKPVLKEIYRVLSPGGVYFIGSDPVKQSLQIKFWRRPTKLRPWEKLLKALLVLPFISHIGKSETEFGIIEEGFDLNTWQKSLSIFNRVEAKITLYPFGPSFKMNNDHGQWSDINTLAKSYLFLFGGDFQAICFKQSNTKTQILLDSNPFACPNCLNNDQSTLVKISARQFKCTQCSETYTKRDNIFILLPKSVKKILNRNLSENS